MVRTKISTTFSVTSMYGITNTPQFEMSQNVARLPVPQIEITQNTARRRWMFFLIQTAYKRCLPESKFLDLILEVAFKKNHNPTTNITQEHPTIIKFKTA